MNNQKRRDLYGIVPRFCGKSFKEAGKSNVKTDLT
jgi:hypothetical protein